MNNCFKNFCNIIRVRNIQQEEYSVSGTNSEKYARSCEMFCVYTADNRYQKLYTYNETKNILKDLLKAGYISYADFYEPLPENVGTFKAGQKSYKLLEAELNQFLIEIARDEYRGVAYCREELAWYQNRLCVVHGGQMHFNGRNMPAFRYKDSSTESRMTVIEKSIGSVEQFKKDMKRFVEPFPLVQLIFSYYLSGAIRQILASSSEGVGEYGLVTCITGQSGSGKTIVTLTLQNVLFGDARQVGNNVTSIGLYKIIKSSGICPVVRDDSSTDTQNSIAHLKDKVMDIYNIASGKCRITSNSDVDVPLYAPFIESREENWGLADVVKPIRQIEGYKYRMLELFCHQGDLTRDAQTAREFGELNGKYRGMAVVFLDYLVDNYTEQDVRNLYQIFVNKMDTTLEKNGLEHRYANRTAVILTAAKICSEAYGVDMELNKIEDVMINSIRSLERRLMASPDIKELKQLYKFFTEKTADGSWVNDEFIADAPKHFIHKKHYVAFLEKKQDEFYIPATLIKLVIENESHCPPGFWGYDRNTLEIDIGKMNGERWKTILKAWAELGILVTRSGQSGFTKTVKLDGISTTCYHFNWKKIAQQFGDNMPIDKMRFAHNTEDEDRREQEEILKSL